MGKKKGGGKKGGKKGKAKKVVDGLSTAEMSRDQLLGHIKRLQAEVDREREERNFFMLEREKLFSLWNMVLEQLAIEKEKARLMDIHLDDAEKEKQGEMDFYKQKLRFLMAEQSKKLGQARLLHLQKMKRVQDELWEVQMIMKEGLMEKKKELRMAQVSLFETIRSMHLDHANEISSLRKEFASEIRRMEMSTERGITRDREVLDSEAKVNISRIKLNKEEQIVYMTYMHEKQLLDMKTFFNDLSVNNLAVITSLQAEIATKKANEQRLKRKVKAITEEYDKLRGPIEEFETKIVQYEHEGREIALARQEFKKAAKQLERNRRYTRMMECANEALLQRCTYIEKERDNLKAEFSRAIIEMQRKTTMKRMVTELKIQAANREGGLSTALANAYEFGPGDGRDYFGEYLKADLDNMIEIRQDISDGATEFRNTLSNIHESFQTASIHLDEIGFPVKKTGAKARPKIERKKKDRRRSSISIHSGQRPSATSLGSSGHSHGKSTTDLGKQLKAVDLGTSPAAEPTPGKTYPMERSHIGAGAVRRASRTESTVRRESTTGHAVRRESMKEPAERRGSMKEPPERRESMKEPTDRRESVKEPTDRRESMKEPTDRRESVKEPTERRESTKEPTERRASTKEPTERRASSTKEPTERKLSETEAGSLSRTSVVKVESASRMSRRPSLPEKGSKTEVAKGSNSDPLPQSSSKTGGLSGSDNFSLEEE